MSNELLRATIVGTETVVRNLGATADKVRAELLKAVDLSALKLLSRVKLKLSDDVLRKRQDVVVGGFATGNPGRRHGGSVAGAEEGGRAFLPATGLTA